MSTKTFCDFHPDEHEGITREVAIKGEEPFLIDTCQAFVDQLKAHAIPRAELVQVAPAGVETTQQPEMDIPAGFAKPAKATKAKKQTAASNAVAVRPVSVTARKHPLDHKCPFCPDVLTQSGYYSHVTGKHGFATPRDAQGPNCPLCKAPSGKLTTHAQNEHGLANAAQLFAAAVEAGDPHGIVAKRRKAAANVELS